MLSQEEFTLSKGRFESFSDGVFAIAITLLILEIHVPSDATHATPLAEQIRGLLSIWPQYFVYVATFATVGIMWINHHALFRYIERITHAMVIANLFLLLLISFLPFATEVVARYGLTPVSVVYYGIVLSLISFGYLFLQRAVIYAHPSVSRQLRLWNVVGLAVYPMATLLGYFIPIAGVLLFGVLALFYMTPANVRSAAIRP